MAEKTNQKLPVILRLILIHLLFSTVCGDNNRIPTGIGSPSGEFNSEEASRDAYAAPKSNRFPDSSSLKRSDRVDVDVDSNSIPEFNEPAGLQAESQDGGVMLPNINGERDDGNSEEYVELSIPEPGTSLFDGRVMLPNINGERDDENSEEYVELSISGPGTSLAEGGVMLPNINGERDDENSEEYVELSIPGPGTSLAEVRRRRFSSVAHGVDIYGILSRLLAVSHSEVPGLESGSRRLSLSSGVLDVVAYRTWSRLRAVTDSEVPDLESGSRRWSTPGAGTSSQVARISNQKLIKLGFAILLGGSITDVVNSIGAGVGELLSRNRFILICVLVIRIVAFVSLVAASMAPLSTPSTDAHTNQTANTILARLGFAASAFGFILVIAMGLPDNLLWVIVLALIVLVFIFIKTSLDRRPRI